MCCYKRLIACKIILTVLINISCKIIKGIISVFIGYSIMDFVVIISIFNPRSCIVRTGAALFKIITLKCYCNIFNMLCVAITFPFPFLFCNKT